MSQTKTGDIFKEIGGNTCFVGEKVARESKKFCRAVKFVCFDIFVLKRPTTKRGPLRVPLFNIDNKKLLITLQVRLFYQNEKCL